MFFRVPPPLSPSNMNVKPQEESESAQVLQINLIKNQNLASVSKHLNSYLTPSCKGEVPRNGG